MLLTMLKAKIHRATVTQADLNYVGSITIDEHLLEKSGILVNEKVAVVNIDNGQRFETYAIKGERDSGVICVNGAAARLVSPGDKVIIMCYGHVTPEEASSHCPKILFMSAKNQIHSLENTETHGPSPV